MNSHVHTEPRIEDPDNFYARLIALHSDLTAEQSQKLNSKLILIMANHIGSQAVLDEMLNMVRSDQPLK